MSEADTHHPPLVEQRHSQPPPRRPGMQGGDEDARGDGQAVGQARHHYVEREVQSQELGREVACKCCIP